MKQGKQRPSRWDRSHVKLFRSFVFKVVHLTASSTRFLYSLEDGFVETYGEAASLQTIWSKCSMISEGARVQGMTKIG
jgi:hypothetical protein